MLTIKKRFPWRRLYFYGSGAVIVGFAGIMTFLVQTNTNLDKFVSLAPSQVAPTQTTKTDDTKSDEAQPTTENVDVASDPGTTTTWNGITKPTQTSNSSASQPPNAAASQPEPTPAQPAEPTPSTEPTTPSEPVVEPEEPDVVDEVIEIITTPTP